MVRFGVFDFRLVQAESKVPFKEHTRDTDGAVFVEVEPEAEYFIQVQRVERGLQGKLILEYEVDGTNLEFYCPVDRDDFRKSYQGLYSRENCFCHTTALKFVKPRILEGREHSSTHEAMMGKVKILIFEGKVRKRTRHVGFSKRLRGDFESTVPSAADEGVSVQPGRSAAFLDKKVVRSTAGSAQISTFASMYDDDEEEWKKGNLLSQFTLNYCTTKGLIYAGILKGPDVWQHYREKYPANASYELAVQPRKVRASDLGNGATGNLIEQTKGCELFDLSALPDNAEVLKQKEWSVRVHHSSLRKPRGRFEAASPEASSVATSESSTVAVTPNESQEAIRGMLRETEMSLTDSDDEISPAIRKRRRRTELSF